MLGLLLRPLSRDVKTPPLRPLCSDIAMDNNQPAAKSKSAAPSCPRCDLNKAQFQKTMQNYQKAYRKKVRMFLSRLNAWWPDRDGLIGGGAENRVEDKPSDRGEAVQASQRPKEHHQGTSA